MGVKRQQGSGDQKDLFDEALKASLRHGDSGDGGTGAGACAEPQACTAWERQRALTRHLMEQCARKPGDLHRRPRQLWPGGCREGRRP